jgi:hypothetical protein
MKSFAYKMREPQRLTNLGTSTASYKDKFTSNLCIPYTIAK